jgi:hypothetical protein
MSCFRDLNPLTTFGVVCLRVTAWPLRAELRLAYVIYAGSIKPRCFNGKISHYGGTTAAKW